MIIQASSQIFSIARTTERSSGGTSISDRRTAASDTPSETAHTVASLLSDEHKKATRKGWSFLWCRWWDSFAAVDIGLSCLRYALRIPPCRKPASLQNTALRCFAVAQSSPFLQTAIEKTTRKGWSFLCVCLNQPIRVCHITRLYTISSFRLSFTDALHEFGC